MTGASVDEISVKTLILLIFSVSQFFIGNFAAYASSGVGVTYHGRLVDPAGNPVLATGVQFRLQIKTPGTENCLMYEEIQSKDMSSSNGVFALTINDGTGSRQDASGFSLDQIFANRSGYTFPGSYCASGTTFTPNPSDGRALVVYFNDGTFPGWEPVPSQSINFIPMAIESMQVGGYKKENLVKVASGVDTTGFDLTGANFAELMALLNGTSVQFVKPSAATFTAAPQWAGTPAAGSDLANKTYVDAQVAAGLPNFGTAGTYTKVTTDAKGRVSGGTTLSASDIPALDAAKITTGVLPIANGGTNSSTALTGSKVMVSSGAAIVEGMASNTAKSNNTFVMRDGTGNIAGALGTFDGLSVLLGGSIGLNGATSGTVNLAAPTAVTSYTFTLPATAGSTGQVLTTNGTGVLSWISPSGGLPASSGTAAAPGYAFSGNTNTGMFGAAANEIGFSTNGTERIRLDSNGNVGIGTTTPNALYKLDIAGSIGVSGAIKSIGYLKLHTPSSGGTNQVLFRDDSGGWETASIIATKIGGSVNSGTLNLSTAGNASQLFLNSDGNVGIGTTSPSSPLHVKTTATSTSSLFEVPCSGCGSWINVFNSDTNLGVNNTSGIRFSSITSGSIYGQISGIQVTGSSLSGALAFATLTGGASTEKMRIDQNGNVGIGTTTPTAKLQVTGQMASTTFNNGSSTSFDMNSGNIQHTSASCGPMTMTNLVDGASYTIVVKGATSGTCTFTATGYSFRFSPANAATVASTHTVYSMQVVGSDVYVSWITGF